MRAFVAGFLLATGWLAEPRAAAALSVQEAILRAKPAVAPCAAEARAGGARSCGRGRVGVSPAPVSGRGAGWFGAGRGSLITSARGGDPAPRRAPWETHERW